MKASTIEEIHRVLKNTRKPLTLHTENLKRSFKRSITLYGLMV